MSLGGGTHLSPLQTGGTCLSLTVRPGTGVKESAMSRRIAGVLLAACALAGAPASRAAAGDWPGWRGPARDGISTESGLLREWPASGPPLAWKVGGVGVGFSSVAVVGDRIYTIGDRDG